MVVECGLRKQQQLVKTVKSENGENLEVDSNHWASNQGDGRILVKENWGDLTEKSEGNSNFYKEKPKKAPHTLS